MSCSKSDDVTDLVCLSVCLCVVILLSLDILKYLKLEIYGVLQGFLMDYGCLKSVPREF